MYRKPVRKKGLSQKLLPHYVGPYEVIKRCDYVTYRLKKLTTSREEVAHVENLKPYFRRDQPDPDAVTEMSAGNDPGTPWD